MDDRFIASLRGTSLARPKTEIDWEAHEVVEHWIADLQLDMSEAVPFTVEVGAHRMIAERWSKLLKVFRGDRWMAEQTAHNLLESKYGSLREGWVT
jgi:hypothetical protein